MSINKGLVEASKFNAINKWQNKCLCYDSKRYISVSQVTA